MRGTLSPRKEGEGKSNSPEGRFSGAQDTTQQSHREGDRELANGEKEGRGDDCFRRDELNNSHLINFLPKHPQMGVQKSSHGSSEAARS